MNNTLFNLYNEMLIRNNIIGNKEYNNTLYNLICNLNCDNYWSILKNCNINTTKDFIKKFNYNLKIKSTLVSSVSNKLKSN